MRNSAPAKALALHGDQEAPVALEHGRTVTFIIGAVVLVLFARALFGASSSWPNDDFPGLKAEIGSHGLAVGTPVLAVDGTLVGHVSGLSRDSRGDVERIRVAGPTPMGLGQRTLIIRNTYFKVEEHSVQLNLTVAEVNAMPRAMTEDEASGLPRLF
jgi:hypothetical protein